MQALAPVALRKEAPIRHQDSWHHHKSKRAVWAVLSQHKVHDEISAMKNPFAGLFGGEKPRFPEVKLVEQMKPENLVYLNRADRRALSKRKKLGKIPAGLKPVTRDKWPEYKKELAEKMKVLESPKKP